MENQSNEDIRNFLVHAYESLKNSLDRVNDNNLVVVFNNRKILPIDVMKVAQEEMNKGNPQQAYQLLLSLSNVLLSAKNSIISGLEIHIDWLTQVARIDNSDKYEVEHNDNDFNPKFMSKVIIDSLREQFLPEMKGEVRKIVIENLRDVSEKDNDKSEDEDEASKF